VWNTEIRETRGLPRGPEQLNALISKNHWKSVFPVLPHAKDIGMLHDAGWSVAHHGKSGVKEIKNTYLMADDFDMQSTYDLLPENIKISNLYSMFSKLDI
jgi:hypothetical protein